VWRWAALFLPKHRTIPLIRPVWSRIGATDPPIVLSTPSFEIRLVLSTKPAGIPSPNTRVTGMLAGAPPFLLAMLTISSNFLPIA